MASIVGIIGQVEKDIIEKMNDSLQHRGRKETEIYQDEFLSLGHNRNAYEISGPWKDQVVILWDGQFFNEDWSREETVDQYLIRRYKAEGLSFLEDLNGDFALAIYDKPKKRLYLVRDRFGSKPLYYTQKTQHGEFLFASECKAFLEVPSFIKKFNPDPLKAYLNLQYVPEKETFFQEVYAVASGHYLEIDCEKQSFVEKEYYRYGFTISQEEEARKKRELKEKLEQAVGRRRPEGEFGTFLSSGVDSSLITALARPNITFTVAYEQEEALFDEARYAKELSEQLSIPHRSLTLTGELAFSDFEKIQYASDNPLGNLSGIPLYYLAKMAKEEVDIVLTGEGADELFGGYASYVDGPTMRKYKKLPFPLRKAIAGLAKAFPTSKADSFIKAGTRLEDYFVGESKVFSLEKANEVLETIYQNSFEDHYYMKNWFDKIKNGTDLQKMQFIDLYTFMPSDIFMKADRMLNQASLITRMPFLDQDIIDFSNSLKDEEKVENGVSKRLLREVAEETLPASWAKRKKLGFPVPLRYWLREEKIYNQIKEAFSSQTAGEFFHRKEILSLLEEHKEARALNQRMIYVLYAFLVWYDEYFIKR